MRIPFMIINLVLALAILLPFAAAQEPIQKASPENGKEFRILCLNPNHILMPWTIDLFNATRDKLAQQLGARVELSIENITLKDLKDPEIVRILKKKYLDKIDFILLRQSHSLLLAAKKIFPDTPIIGPDFSTLGSLDEVRLSPNAYIVNSPLSIKRSAQLISRLLPNTKKVVVITGSGPIGDKLHKLALHQLGSMINGMAIDYWVGIPLSDLLIRSSKEPSDTAILFLIQWEDENGRRYISKDVAFTLCEHSKIPVFGIANTYLGENGIIGGYIHSAEIVGQRGASIMEAISKGHSPPHLQFVTDYGEYQFDWRQLQRWDIDMSSLPANSNLLYKPESFFALYPIAKPLIAIGGSCVVVFLIVVQLYWHRRKKFVDEIIRNEKRYKSLFDASHLSLWEEDMSGLVPIFEELKNRGVTNWTSFFSENIEELQRCAGAIKITDMNNATIKLHEAKNREDLLDNIAETFSQRSWDAFGYEVAELAKGERHITVDGGIKTLKGRELDVLVYADVLAGYEETLERVIVTIVDLTEKRSLEMQLSQAQKLEAIGSLASGVAHEINTPLQYISGNLSFINKTISEIKNPENAQLVQEIVDASQDSILGTINITNIVQAMKRLAHPSQENIRASDINDLVRTVVMVTKNEWKYNSELELQLADDLPLVNCNPGEISQVILNLIINASHAVESQCKLTDLKGHITVSTSLNDKGIKIEVADNGCGMSASTKKQIFDPFFTTKEVGKGTGQGLSIALSIINNHRGTLEVQSEEGSGSRFSIQLPLN